MAMRADDVAEGIMRYGILAKEHIKGLFDSILLAAPHFTGSITLKNKGIKKTHVSVRN